MQKRILVTGANGQLGRCLQDLSKTTPFNNDHYLFTDIDTLDITNEIAVNEVVANERIDIIINAAAYTAVDKAEDDVEMAYRLNRDAVGNLARAAKKHNAMLVHISTDYVFSGQDGTPHSEDDSARPLSVYGASKYDGELEIVMIKCKSLIIRTSWLYSEYGNNFLKTMLRLGDERESIGVVCDQVGAPTYAGDLARTILTIISQDPDYVAEVYHFANEGVCSWYDFAKAIMEFSGKKCVVNPILTSQYAVKARRPSYSVFNLSKIKNGFDLEIPYWRDSLRLIINKLKKQ